MLNIIYKKKNDEKKINKNIEVIGITTRSK